MGPPTGINSPGYGKGTERGIFNRLAKPLGGKLASVFAFKARIVAENRFFLVNRGKRKKFGWH